MLSAVESQMPNFRYLDAPCGAGKTHFAAKAIVDQKKPHLVVRDRLEAIEEFKKKLVELQPSLSLIEVTSKTDADVRSQLRDVPSRYETTGSHLVVLATHAAMQMTNLDAFAGWSIWIDEVPTVFVSETMRSELSRDFLKQCLTVRPIEPGSSWGHIELTEVGWRTALKRVEGDTALRVYRTLFEKVRSSSVTPETLPARIAKDAHSDRSRVVIADIIDWSEVIDKAWTWWSVWSLASLDAFDDVTFMANNFRGSVTFAMFEKFSPDIEWQRLSIDHREFSHRRVDIEYFACEHPASANLFSKPEGKERLRLIAEYLSDREQIWMANGAHREFLSGMGGTELRPKQAGTNRYDAYHAATCVYSAKPSPAVVAILEALDLDPMVWTETHEFETILQFVTRTSIRDPESFTPVTLTVYDRRQADYLARYFQAQLHCEVTTQLIDLGFANEPQRRDPVRQRMTADETRKIDRERKRRDRANLSAEKREEQNRKRRERYARKRAVNDS